VALNIPRFLRQAAACLVFLGLLAPLAQAKPQFGGLLYNSKWYRTYDSTSDILPEGGELLFAWSYLDPQSKPDSFFVGIDTLWALPQDVDGDTAEDWDLQVCPDRQCMDGLKKGVHGANAPFPWDTVFQSEHHFQFFPAVSPTTYRFVAPEHSLFGGLMFVRSRSTGQTDTVLGYGGWHLHWDSTSPPPIRPVDGYLPRRSDFIITGDTVKYVKGANAGVTPRLLARKDAARPGLRTNQVLFAFPETGAGGRGWIFDARGRLVWKPLRSPGAVPAP
jgi:hypothetical protein